MWLLCLKMRAQIWGYLGQMAHRRQIAQWAGTRTTHPGGTGFETGTCPKLGSACGHSRRGFLCPPKHAPGFSVAKKNIFVRKT